MNIKSVEKVLRAIANEYVIGVEGDNLVARDPGRTKHDERGENIGMMRNKPGNWERLEATLNGRRVPTGMFPGEFSVGNGMVYSNGHQYK